MGNKTSKAKEVKPYFGALTAEPATPRPKPGDPGTTPVHPLQHYAYRPPTPPKMSYILPFTFTLQFLDDNPEDPDTIADALERVGAAYTWTPYLDSTMRDAWLLERQKDVDYEDDVPAVHRLPSPPRIKVKHVSVTLHATDEPLVWAGEVRWSSGALPLGAMEAAISWRIGDRMSGFEVQDHDSAEPTWVSSIVPGVVTVV